MGCSTIKYAAKASHNLGINAHATLAVLYYGNIFILASASEGLVEDGFAELAKRWLPILNEFDQNGVDFVTKFTLAKIYLMVKPMKCF
jgi:hypothetical protein